MTARTRYRLLTWPVAAALVAGVWWGLITLGVPWWAVPIGAVAFVGFLTLVGLWVGAVEDAHKARKEEEEAKKSADPDWDGAVAQLLTEEERNQGWRDPRGPDGDR